MSGGGGSDRNAKDPLLYIEPGVAEDGRLQIHFSGEGAARGRGEYRAANRR
jgi:hypothetical protein